MTSLFGSRRRAEEFAARADGATSGATRARETAPWAPDPETDALLELVAALRGAGAATTCATPREAFSPDLRERLVAEAATVLVAAAARRDARSRPARRLPSAPATGGPGASVVSRRRPPPSRS